MSRKFVADRNTEVRRGVAPLEVVLVLPLLVLMFAFIFYLGSTCRQHVSHLQDTRNTVWKQRYVKAAPESTPFSFPSSKRSLNREYIVEDSSRTFKTGTVFDKLGTEKNSVANYTVLTGKTWDFDTVETNRVPNYYRQPFLRIPNNLESLGSVQFPGHQELVDMLTIEAVRQYLVNMLDENLEAMLAKIIKAGGTAFRDKLLEAGRDLLLGQLGALQGDFFVDRILELGGEAMLDKLIGSATDALCQELTDRLLQAIHDEMDWSNDSAAQTGVVRYRPVQLQIVRYFTIPSSWPTWLQGTLTATLDVQHNGFTKQNLLDALKKASKSKLIALAGAEGLEKSVNNVIASAKKTLNTSWNTVGSNLLAELKKWGKDVPKQILQEGGKQLISLVKQKKSAKEVTKLLGDWAAQRVMSEAKTLGNRLLSQIPAYETLKAMQDLFEQVKNIAGNLQNFFKDFEISMVVDLLLDVVKGAIRDAAFSAVAGFNFDFQIGKMEFEFEFKFEWGSDNLIQLIDKIK